MSSLLHSASKTFLLLLFAICYLLFANPSFAQTSTPSSQLSNNQTSHLANSYALSSNPNNATKAIYDFGHAMNCILIGQSLFGPCLQYKTLVDTEGIIRSVPILSSADTSMGVLGFGSAALGSLFETKPLSSAEFLTQMGSNIGLIDEAHAQVGGSGSTILSPIYKLWLVSRNIAYLCMIAIFLIVGFMVMFRQKLNPQTVVTVQLALPGLVIGLVMITFSYFIASLITDMAFLGTDLVGYFFQAAQTGPNSNPSLSQLISSQNSIAIMSRMTSAIGNFDISSGINSFMDNLTGRPLFFVKTALAFLAYQYGGQALSAVATPIGALAGAALPVLTTGGAGIVAVPATAGAGATLFGVISTLVGGGLAASIATLTPGIFFTFIISFILTIMLIITIFKLIFKLIQNFLSIIFYTIISPFVFLMSSLPGRQGLVNDWVRNMLCNVLAFPAVIAVLYFCYYILTNGQPLAEPSEAFRIADINAIPLTNNSALPLLGGLNLSVLNMLIGFGAFLATPTIPDIVCKAIGKIGPAAGMIEGNITGAQRSAQGYSRQATGASGQLSKDFSGIKQLGDQKAVNLWGEYKVSSPGAWNYMKNLGKPKV